MYGPCLTYSSLASFSMTTLNHSCSILWLPWYRRVHFNHIRGTSSCGSLVPLVEPISKWQEVIEADVSSLHFRTTLHNAYNETMSYWCHWLTLSVDCSATCAYRCDFTWHANSIYWLLGNSDSQLLIHTVCTCIYIDMSDSWRNW